MKKRIAYLFITIFVSLFLTFILIKLMPGDPVTRLANELVTSQGISFDDAKVRAIYMLNYDPDQSTVEQFYNFIIGLFKGELGTSLRFKVPVTEIIASALPWTMFIAGSATLLSFFVGTKIGLYVSFKKSSRLETLTDVSAAVLGSIPDYIVGIFLLILFSVTLSIFPSKGAYSSAVTPSFTISFILDALYHAVLPITSLFLVYLAGWVLNMRSVTKSIMNEDYLTYAQARGLSNNVIRNKYIKKNAILPMLTSLAITFGFLVGGAPLIENLFAYPGVGYYLNVAIATRDIPLMQGMFFVIITTVVMTNFITEILYSKIDPRLRRQK